ncbi:cupin domain-containing protein [Mycobacterium sp. E2733]|uniref:cupin domain-containing protein n=1 Tax=Mycobacterium sp. E2733 TaxID=1834138 RepID=UPI0008006E97|nr:cupin domain-containing protein [Mycobacterium sp. E2733]OBH92407.1 cupin [Mycobacterium sp. E2733]
MTFANEADAPRGPAILAPEVQQAVWFLGGLVWVRAGGNATAGKLAVLEHQAERGYSSPVHRHLVDDETLFVLDGEVRVEVDGEAHPAGAGAVAFLPRQLPHAFLVTSPQARFLTLHTPAGFDGFAVAAGTPVTDTAMIPPGELPPDPAALAAMASSYGIEIVGPPPTLHD